MVRRRGREASWSRGHSLCNAVPGEQRVHLVQNCQELEERTAECLWGMGRGEPVPGLQPPAEPSVLLGGHWCPAPFSLPVLLTAPSAPRDPFSFSPRRSLLLRKPSGRNSDFRSPHRPSCVHPAPLPSPTLVTKDASTALAAKLIP